MAERSFTAEEYAGEPVVYPQLQILDLAAEGRAVTEDYKNLVLNRINLHCLRLAVFEGTYPWHHHPGSDELFLVLEGCLIVDLADGRELRLGPWQAATVPAGMMHRTRTEGRTVNLCFEALGAETVFGDPPIRFQR